MASARASEAMTHANEQDKVQNFGLRTIPGAIYIYIKAHPIAEVKKTAGAEPLGSRRQAKLFIYAEKMKRMPDHSLHRKLKDPAKTD